MDEIIPANVLSGVDQYFSNGWHSKYPPLHYYILSFFYLPFYFLQRLHLVNMESNFGLYSFFFYLGRFLSVLMATAIVFLVYRIGCELFESRAAIFAALISTLLGPFVFYAKLTNTDIPYIFWFVLSLLFFVRILKLNRLHDYLFFALTATCAICTKDQAYGFYILAPIPIAIMGYLHKKKSAPGIKFFQALFNRKVFLALGMAILSFALFYNLIFNFSGFIKHFELITGLASKGYQIYPNTLHGHFQMFLQALTHLRFVFGWPLFLVCLCGLISEIFLKKNNLLQLSILLFGISYYLFFISRVLYHYERFFIPIAILLAFFGGKGLADWLKPRKRFYSGKILLFSLVVVYSIWNAASVDINMITDSRYSIEKWMLKNISSEKTIGFIGMLECLPRSMHFKKSLSIFLPTTEKIQLVKPDYLVFNPAVTFGSPKLYEHLRLEEIGYIQVLHYQKNCKWTSFDQQTFFKNGRELIFSNLDKISPEIIIYRLAYKWDGSGPSLSPKL